MSHFLVPPAVVCWALVLFFLLSSDDTAGVRRTTEAFSPLRSHDLSIVRRRRSSSYPRFLPFSDRRLSRLPPHDQGVRSAQAKRSQNFVEDDDNDNDEDETDYDSLWSSSSTPSLLPETSFGSELVPEGQRPINEYLNILRQPLFDWALSDSKLLVRIGLVLGVFWIAVCYPIAGATFTQPDMLWPKLTSSTVGAVSITLVLIVRLYSGWAYVGNRLKSPLIEYEETGWYDGDCERKTMSEQKRDKFVYQSKVQPIIQRLQRVLWIGTALWLASILAFNVASSNQPMFDQYNPDLLEQLQYDEKLAEQAAHQAGNRPTYCDNRYYRAVAGAAPGCQ